MTLVWIQIENVIKHYLGEIELKLYVRIIDNFLRCDHGIVVM